MTWLRHRFKANASDPRPVAFPPPGPYWVSGYGEDYSIVVAFLPSDVDVVAYWPEARDIDSEEKARLEFTSRFPEPTWWRDLQQPVKGTPQ